MGDDLELALAVIAAVCLSVAVTGTVCTIADLVMQ